MKKLWLAIIAVSCLMTPNLISAQTGAISGMVTDSLGDGIQYARISITGTANADITDIDGSYFIDNLPTGSYDLAVTRSEFHDEVISGIAVEQNSTTEVDIELLPSQFASLGGPTSNPGNLTTIPISINNTISIDEFDFLFTWPADYLTANSVTPANRIDYGNFSYIVDDAGPGTIRIHWDAGAGSPLTGGSDPVIWLQVRPDTSLGNGNFVPVWFDGSPSDNAVFDSLGQEIKFDGYRGNSIFIHDEPWLAYNPNANGCLADIGDLAILADRIIYGYIVWSRNGTGDDAIQESAADINGNGFGDGADLVMFINLAQGNTAFGNYPILRFVSDIDPGERDVIAIGNLDGSPIIGYPGQTVDIPIYAKTDEVIRGMALRIMSDNTRISEYVGAESTSVIADWDFDVSSQIDYQPGLDGRTALMIAGYGEGLNTEGQWSEPVAYFTLRLADSGFNGGETVQFRARANITDTSYIVYQPVIIEGSILVDIAGCDYVYGDVNGNGEFNGLDIIYAVAYFKGQNPPPPTDCYCGIHGFYGANADANGDCRFNGIDVLYSVSALKATGPMPVGCPDCPEL